MVVSCQDGSFETFSPAIEDWQDIDIFDIPISRITDQFLQAIKSLDATDLDGAGEFLEMAATLRS